MERTRIAREIHDELGQALTALKMELHWCLKRLPKDNPELLEKAKTLPGLVDANVHLVQRIASELRPGLLDHLGLSAGGTDTLPQDALPFPTLVRQMCPCCVATRESSGKYPLQRHADRLAAVEIPGRIPSPVRCFLDQAGMDLLVKPDDRMDVVGHDHETAAGSLVGRQQDIAVFSHGHTSSSILLLRSNKRIVRRISTPAARRPTCRC